MLPFKQHRFREQSNRRGPADKREWLERIRNKEHKGKESGDWKNSRGEKQVDFNFYMKHFQSPTSIVRITVNAQGRIN